ncbi:Hypothetical_protein [Hexamita inflata]|uniref:Hypothetical_protein n=1 Tax=Hexamita inflata TaxID=28002 RepID=A0AA86UWC1_9EUKA|nr:Hypothetical protein HINF_LOCUS62130 [Hexamita inflata]
MTNILKFRQILKYYMEKVVGSTPGQCNFLLFLIKIRLKTAVRPKQLPRVARKPRVLGQLIKQLTYLQSLRVHKCQHSLIIFYHEIPKASNTQLHKGVENGNPLISEKATPMRARQCTVD